VNAPNPTSTSLARKELARLIDHTLRRSETTTEEIKQLCAEAREHGFFSVCVSGSRVAQAAAQLEDSDVKVTAALSFPLGNADTDVKRYETEVAIDHGAHVIEVAVNIAFLKDGNDAALLRELRDVVEASDERPVSVWFDLELLRPDETARLCQAAVESGAKGVSLAVHAGATASVNALKMIGPFIGPNFGAKIEYETMTRDEVLRLLDAGATRFGMRNGAQWLAGL